MRVIVNVEVDVFVMEGVKLGLGVFVMLGVDVMVAVLTEVEVSSGVRVSDFTTAFVELGEMVLVIASV